MRHFVIPEIFFKKIAEKGKLNPIYYRLWFGYWLIEYVDEIFEPDFIEKQVKTFPKVREIKEVYDFGLQFLQQDFKIINKKKHQKPVQKEIKLISAKILDYLNEQVGTSFQNKGTNIQLIAARISEGYNLTDFIKVIDNKVYDWKGGDYQSYLRPLTLFSKTHFENYLNGTHGKQNNKQPITNDSIRKAAEELIIIRKDR